MFKVFLSLGNEQFSDIDFSEVFNLCIQYFSQNPSEQEYTGSGEVVVGNASPDILVLSGNIDTVVPAAGDGRPRVLFNRQGSPVAVGELSLPPEQSIFLLNNRTADSTCHLVPIGVCLRDFEFAESWGDPVQTADGNEMKLQKSLNIEIPMADVRAGINRYLLSKTSVGLLFVDDFGGNYYVGGLLPFVELKIAENISTIQLSASNKQVESWDWATWRYSTVDMDGGMFLDWDNEYYCKWED